MISAKTKAKPKKPSRSNKIAKEFDGMLFERNMIAHPYSDDEKRIVNWLWNITGIGGGNDPIGFFIASYESLIHERKELKREIAALTLDRDRLFTLCRADTESSHPDGRDLVEDSLDIAREYVKREQNGS